MPLPDSCTPPPFQPLASPVMPPGPLMIIGGAEDKVRKPTILKHFVALSGGKDARIAVIPTASSLGREVVEVYDTLFTKFGAAHVDAVRPESREQAHDPVLVKALDEATGIFMTGGNQLKLSSIVCGTPVGDAIVRAHERGAVVGGTSAGASIQSSHMVAFGVGRLDAQAADDPGRRRPRPRRHHRHRPALRPAQPLRPAADDRRPEPPAARASGSTRTPAGGRSPRRTDTDAAGASAAGAVTHPRRLADGDQRPRGQASPRRCSPAASSSTSCPAAPRST